MNKKLITEVKHPLIQHKLTLLRDKTTPHYLFRQLTHEIASILFLYATESLSLVTKSIDTPLCQYQGNQLADKEPIILPILRAGLSMVPAFLELIPTAKQGFIGLVRNEATHHAQEYYFKVPEDIASHDVFICDPMLATGGSASAAITKIKEQGVESLTLVSIIAAPEGIARVHKDHPNIPIFIAGLDHRLNEQAYIEPGLGDAGDRATGST